MSVPQLVGRGLAPLVCVAAMGVGLDPDRVWAQAWVMPGGEGAVTISHQFIASPVHIDRTGTATRELGRETIHVAVSEVSYGVTDRLTSELTLVGLATRWEGPDRHRHGPLDTGDFHYSMQDMRVAVRYQLLDGSLKVAPFVAFGGPTTDYDSRGHSAFGRHLEEFTVGASVGGSDAIGAYWQATAAYSIVNDIDSEDFNLDHANADVEVGLAIGSRFTVRAFGSGQWMWDGLKVGPQTDHLHLLTDHDRFTQSSFLNLGGGAAVALTPRLDLSVSAFTTASARNFHAVRALATSLTWKFGGGFRITPPPRETGGVRSGG